MKTVLVLSGGIALGAYQAGAYARLHRRDDLRPQHIAGTSVGAINAALIAGGPPEQSIERLQRFWMRVAIEDNPFATQLAGPFVSPSWRHASSWASALQTRLFGRSSMFMPRLPELFWRHHPSLYDLTPLRATFEQFIDFDRLNSGDVRTSVTTTDAETGEAVVFDTDVGDRIGPDHLLASCGLFPDFAPTEISGRLLADGGFVANAPVQAALSGDEKEDIMCFVVDLFSARGAPPRTLEQAASRQWELLFGNQSREKLSCLEREHRLRRALHDLAAQLGPDFGPGADIAALLAQPAPRSVNVFHIAYRPKAYEAGPEKTFDFSHAMLGDRWKAGSRDMAEAVEMATDLPTQPGFFVHDVACCDCDAGDTDQLSPLRTWQMAFRT
jgi:NTE family protein